MDPKHWKQVPGDGTADPLLEYLASLDRGGDFAERMEDELIAPCPCGSGQPSLLCDCLHAPARPGDGGGESCTP